MTVAEQTEMVPLTAAERVAQLRRALERAADKATERVEKAQDREAAALADLAEFDATIELVAREGVES